MSGYRVMQKPPMKHLRDLVEKAYLIAFKYRETQILLVLGLAMDLIADREVAERIALLGVKEEGPPDQKDPSTS